MTSNGKTNAKRGRPPGTTRVPADELTVKQTVSLRPSHIATAKRLGGGNVSKGIRVALEREELSD